MAVTIITVDPAVVTDGRTTTTDAGFGYTDSPFCTGEQVRRWPTLIQVDDVNYIAGDALIRRGEPGAWEYAREYYSLRNPVTTITVVEDGATVVTEV